MATRGEQPREVQEATNRLMVRLTLVVDGPTAATIFRKFADEYRTATLATAETGDASSIYELRVPMPDELDDFQRQVVVEAFRMYTLEFSAALSRASQGDGG